MKEVVEQFKIDRLSAGTGNNKQYDEIDIL
jgi:hypothetical protein